MVCYRIVRRTDTLGPCQFPTLGFVVERYWQVQSFVPEDFWYIKCVLEKDGEKAECSWGRHRLFDQYSAAVLYERVMEQPMATIVSMETKPTTKWSAFCYVGLACDLTLGVRILSSPWNFRNVPRSLFTCPHILQWILRRSCINEDILAIRAPRPNPSQMASIFGQSWLLSFLADISRALIALQEDHPQWGQYARRLLEGGFRQPRRGKGDDAAHPAIHPTKPGTDLQGDEARIYELITRHFLACCSDDAKVMLSRLYWTARLSHK